MTESRRAFVGRSLRGISGAQAAGILSGSHPHGHRAAPIRAIAFDALAIFNPEPVGALTETIYPGKGAALMEVWRTRQFEYTWLRVLSGHYVDFEQVTHDSLVFATRRLKLDLTVDNALRLENRFHTLTPWPDVLNAVTTLLRAGLKLSLLSNFTPAMLRSNVRSAGLEGLITHMISTDKARTYKPDPRAYRLGIETHGVPKEQILFVAFAGWDAAGAKSFGYPTFWLNRLHVPMEELGTQPDAAGTGMADLVEFVAHSRSL